MALMGRAYSQAQKFGVEMAIPDEAVRLHCGNDPCRLELANGEQVQAESIVIASGARYRRLEVDRLHVFEGISVHYWASPLEADLCADNEVALVGGGNSAGQATVFLASPAKKVTLSSAGRSAGPCRNIWSNGSKACRMSTSSIGAEVAGAGGRGWASSLQSPCAIVPRVRTSDGRYPHLFSFIGAEPNTDWLAGTGIKLDPRGFVLTGADAGDDHYPLGTSRRGIFAIGDVRSGSVKRVAAAVGDGAQVVAAIHLYLAAAGEGPVIAAQPMPAAV